MSTPAPSPRIPRLLVCSILTLATALSGCARREVTPPVRSGPQLVQAESVRWDGESQYTPELGGRELVVASARSVYDRQLGVTLHGRYRVPSLYRARYGEGVAGALFVVAVNEENQRAWAAPLDPEAAFGGDPMTDEAAEGAVVEGTFNLVLREALGLPYQEATYSVFLWLDELASETVEVTLPIGARIEPHGAPLTGTLWLTETPGPDADENSVNIELDPENPDSLVGSVRRVAGTEREPLMVMGIARPSNVFAYNRAQFPVTPGAEENDGQNFRFDLEVKDLFREPPTGGRVWTMGWFHGSRSPILSASVTPSASTDTPANADD